MATGATGQNIFFPFLPTSIAGCQLWLDGADSTSTANVTSGTWLDKSGLSHTATSNAGGSAFSMGTINGLSAVTFPSASATAFIAQAPITLSSSVGFSIFFIARWTQAVSQNARFFSTQWSAGGTLDIELFSSPVNTIPGTGNLYGGTTSAGASLAGITLPSNTPFVYSAVFTSTATNGYSHWLNGSSGGSQTPAGAGTVNGMVIGNYSIPSGNYEFIGQMGEFIVYSTALSTNQRQQVEAYLAWKWGTQGVLDATNPYKNAVPQALPTLNTSQITTIPLSLQKYSAFIPTLISGCQLWMDAADSTTITRSGANVTQWNDKANNYSGSATNNPQYNSSPINGLPTIHFDGASSRYVLISANNFNYSFMTYFIVIRWVSGSGGFMGTDTPGNYGRALAVSSPNVQLLLYSQFYTTTVALTANQPCILSAYFNGTTNFTVILNGTPTVFAVGQGAGNTNTNGFNIGLFNPTNGGNHSFDMGEGIVYNSILSDAQRQQVEGYLAWKWGLQANLPAGHPYLNNNNYYNPFPTTTPAKTISISSIFKPTNYAGCQLWLDAFDPFGNGSRQKSPLTLTRWVDKSSSARHATMFNGSSIAYSPTAFNNKPAFLFTQTQNMSSAAAAGTFSSAFTFFIIYQRMSGGTYDTLVTRTAGALAAPLDIYAYLTNANFYRNVGNGTAQSAYNTASGSNFINVTTPSLYYANATPANGLLDAFNFATPTNPSSGVLTGVYYGDNGTAIYIGTRADSVTTLTASVSEVIVYSTTPTDQQRQTIEGYLAWKWGLVASLPAGHPYKNYPPPPQ